MRLIQAGQLWGLRPRSDRHEQADRDAKPAVRQLLDTHNRRYAPTRQLHPSASTRTSSGRR